MHPDPESLAATVGALEHARQLSEALATVRFHPSANVEGPVHHRGVDEVRRDEPLNTIAQVEPAPEKPGVKVHPRVGWLLATIQDNEGASPSLQSVIVARAGGSRLGRPELGRIECIEQIAKGRFVVNAVDFFERRSEPPHVLSGKEAGCFNLAVACAHVQALMPARHLKRWFIRLAPGDPMSRGKFGPVPVRSSAQR